MFFEHVCPRPFLLLLLPLQDAPLSITQSFLYGDSRDLPGRLGVHVLGPPLPFLRLLAGLYGAEMMRQGFGGIKDGVVAVLAGRSGASEGFEQAIRVIRELGS